MSRQSVLKRAAGWLANICWPPHCPTSGRPVSGHGTLHPQHWQELHFITAPMCTQCGLPFQFAVDGLQRCAACIAEPPPYALARAVCSYDDASRALVTGLKYNDRTQLARMLAEWMQRAGQELWVPDALLLPVPLHRRRLWQRRYNQSALLVRALAKRTGLECCLNVLKRTRHTPPQTRLSGRQRQRNVKGAFRVSDKERIAGRICIVIDDVMTTGATLKACTNALLRAGAAEVRVLTVARTL